VERKQWTVPIENHAQGVYYNKDWLKKAGVEFPKTWEDLVTVAKATTDAKAGTFGFEFPIGRNEYVMWWMATFLAQNGARVTNTEETKATINDPKAVEAIQYFQDLVHKHKVAPLAGQIQAGPEGSFRGKFVAMSCSGSWGLQPLLKEPPQFDWGWGLVPYPTNGKNVQGISAGWHWTMWREGKNKDATGKLMLYMTSEDWLIPVADKFRAITVRQSVAAKRPMLKEYPWSVCMEMIEKFGAVTRSRPTEYPLVTDAAQQAIDNAVTGNMSVQAATDEAAAKINDALSKAAPCVS
jgi:N,N'-diacetylchitobiose transport system substrate-binding protein